MDFIFLNLFLFLVYIRPQDFAPEFQGARLVLVVMCLTIASWVLFELPKQKTKLLQIAVDYWIVFLFAAILLSTVKVNWIWFTFSTFTDFLKIAAFYFMTAFIINNQKRMEFFVRLLVVLTTVICFIAILQIYGIDLLNVGILIDFRNPDMVRIQGAGIFCNPNYLAYTAAFSFPFAFNLLFRKREFGNHVLGLISVITIPWAIVLTRSRGGILCFILLLFFLFGQTKKRIIRLLINIVSGLTILFVVSNGFGRMGSLLKMQSDSSIMDRINLWYLALLYFKKSPFIGLGLGQFMEYAHQVTHGAFVGVGVETGAIGLFFWVGLLYFMIKNIRWTLENTAFDKSILMGYEGAVVAFILTSFFANMEYWITLFILAGLISATQRIVISDNLITSGNLKSIVHNGFNKRDLRNVALLTAATIWLWHFIIKTIG